MRFEDQDLAASEYAQWASSLNEALPERGRDACAVREGRGRARARPQVLNHHRRSIQRTAHRQASSLQDMGIDHRGFHILVPEQFLHSADVVVILQ